MNLGFCAKLPRVDPNGALRALSLVCFLCESGSICLQATETEDKTKLDQKINRFARGKV